MNRIKMSLTDREEMSINTWISMNLIPRKTVNKQWCVGKVRDVFINDTGMSFVDDYLFRQALINYGYELTGCYLHASSRSRAFDPGKAEERSMI